MEDKHNVVNKIWWNNASNAVRFCEIKKLHSLIPSKFDANTVSDDGTNLLHIALFQEKVSLDVVQALINLQVPINGKTREGATVLELAMRKENHYEILKMLISNGAEIDSVGSSKCTFLDNCKKADFLDRYPRALDALHEGLADRFYKSGRFEGIAGLDEYLIDKPDVKEMLEAAVNQGGEELEKQADLKQKILADKLTKERELENCRDEKLKGQSYFTVLFSQLFQKYSLLGDQNNLGETKAKENTGDIKLHPKKF